MSYLSEQENKKKEICRTTSLKKYHVEDRAKVVQDITDAIKKGPPPKDTKKTTILSDSATAKHIAAIWTTKGDFPNHQKKKKKSSTCPKRKSQNERTDKTKDIQKNGDRKKS